MSIIGVELATSIIKCVCLLDAAFVIKLGGSLVTGPYASVYCPNGDRGSHGQMARP